MPTTAEKILALAKSQVGVKEGRSGGRGNNNTRYADEVPGLEWADFQPWCATFVSWLALKSGIAALYPRTASCDVAGSWFKKAGRWSEYPAVGAQVFYGYPHDLNHTGIVVSFDADSITTIEGNTNDDGGREGDGVYLRKRLRRGKNVIGYGYPRFPEGIVSADPKWSKAPAPTPKPPVTAPPVTAPPSTVGFKLGRIDFTDWSHWNTVGPAGLRTSVGSGLCGTYHKATQGLGFTDGDYIERRAWIREITQHGAYHFAEPLVSNGEIQARYFLDFAKVEGGDLRPMLDLEGDKYRGNMSRAALTKWVGQFVNEVKRKLGVAPWIYTTWDLDDNFGCPLWVPRYNDAMKLPRVPEPWATFDAWQFSNGHDGKPNRMPGFSGVPLDLNTFNGDPAAMIRRFTLGTPTLEEDDMTPAQMDQLLTKVQTMIDTAIDKRVGDVVPIPANLEGVWKEGNDELTVASALSYIMSKVGAPAGEQPGK
ncbi:MAG TPA: GH25 family lysozyme [Propionibacteriaceae bacterium]|jgi:GH25 family lysozyme M1 (1,4-beta-N-acetylmuramidase)